MSREDILNWLLIALMVLAPTLGELLKHLKKRFTEKARPQMTVAERYRAQSADDAQAAPPPPPAAAPSVAPTYGFTPEEEGGRILDDDSRTESAALSEADAERVAAHRRRWRQAVIDCEVLGRRHF